MIFNLGVLVLIYIPTQTLLLRIETCRDELGLENGELKDSAFSASSSYDPTNVGPKNARLRSDVQGGAWCPREPVTREKNDQYLEVDLPENYVISEVLTQGRFANGQGQEYTQAYRIHYWRDGMQQFKEYRDNIGKTVLDGNKDTYTVARNLLNPPIIGSKIRILPFSNHSRTVCLRLGLRGCKFKEGVVSYNIPQGMVRGSTLELLDITYDGTEDYVTGNLRGGLGQLTDGKYGSNNFKATGENGMVKGYEWVGWKNRSMSPLQMDFTFDRVRTFSRMDIHVNNHYSRDIQIFSRAKIYFSNEEGKFGDDRAVDFFYDSGGTSEEARNVTIDLGKEHGKFIMMHLYFSSKWILISEITFSSDIYEEKPFRIEGETDIHTTPQYLNPVSVNLAEESSFINSESSGSEDQDTNFAGPIIGVLVTLISILVAGIFFVVYRGRQGKETPSHILLATKIQDKLDFKDMTSSYTPYKAKMRVYGHISVNEQDGNLYSNPIHSAPYSVSFPSLHKKCSSDTVLSEDYTDDYAEPQLNLNQLNSASLSDNIYSQAHPPTHKLSQPQINHYSKPISPISPGNKIFSSPDSQPFLTYTPPKRFSPPQRHSPPKTLNLQHIYSSRRGVGGVKNRSASHLEMYSPTGPMREGTISPSQSSLSSVDRIYSRPRQDLPLYSKVQKTSPENFRFSGSKLSSLSLEQKFQDGRKMSLGTDPRKQNQLQLETKRSNQLQDLNKNLTQVPLSQPNLILRSQLKLLERIGRGQFGEVHLCHLISGVNTVGSTLVAVKSLETNSSSIIRGSFETEAQILSTINDPNIAKVVGANFDSDPNFMACEFSDMGDLNQYLQDHVAETSLSCSSGVSTLRFGSLIYMATQISSGMKYLESINFIHRDLATRNCLVYPRYGIKISDCGSVRSVYNSDYYTSLEGGRLPIRWMAWESVVLAKYTTKSDVWSFGVTFWEILTFAREQPFEELGDEKVLENISALYDKKKMPHSLSRPYNCPRDIFDLISECWAKVETERPSFREIHLFLQRKNLGFSPEDE